MNPEERESILRIFAVFVIMVGVAVFGFWCGVGAANSCQRDGGIYDMASLECVK